METLYRAYRTLLNNTSTDFVRYLHDQIEWDSRLIAILGARGIGKTTMLLQHIKQYDNIDESKFRYIGKCDGHTQSNAKSLNSSLNIEFLI